jgi:hypothetical protein
MPEKMTLAKRTHPLYDDNKDKWELYRNAVKGGDDFINDTNLFSHRLEDTEDFGERLDRAYYLNFCETIPNIYNSFIFKERIERPPDTILEPFRINTDRRGTNISSFISKVGFFSKIFGVMHVLVDMPIPPKKGKRTVAYDKKNNMNPYCSLIYPDQLVDWSLDRDGNFRWVVIKSIYYEDTDPAKEREEKEHYKLITTDEWRIEDDKGQPAKMEEYDNKGKNTLGLIPMVSLYHRDVDDDKIGESMIKDIVYVNRALLNWCSCLDEQIERQTFSQLVIPDDGSLYEESETGDDPLRKLGTASAWTFNAESRHPPAFISPNADNLSIIWGLVIDHIKEIYRIAGLIGSSDDMYVGSSGKARQMGFLSVNSALADTAMKYQKFENDISRMAYLQLGKDPITFGEVKYPDSFDIIALSDEIDSMLKIMERNFSPILNKTMQKNIARRALPMITDTVRQEIENEIDSGTGIVEPIVKGFGQEEAKGEGKDSGKGGNPTSKVSDTYRTKGKLEKEKTSHKTVE